jgi:hypothetical protein
MDAIPIAKSVIAFGSQKIYLYDQMETWHTTNLD